MRAIVTWKGVEMFRWMVCEKVGNGRDFIDEGCGGARYLILFLKEVSKTLC